MGARSSLGRDSLPAAARVLERFAVLPYDRALCAKWAEVTIAAQARGRRIDCADAWIAATALISGAPLITHNHDDYLGVPGLVLISHG
ncbi:MAG: type II toxin-antitoxin system VapC family toxin [Bryobacterales bacterium]|nr:type II toxin-antitoxin system VapC family toxin [Bryobacterales bacterium]